MQKLKKHYKLIVVIIILLTSAYYYFYKDSIMNDLSMDNLSKEQVQKVNEITLNSPTHCIGTYLLDFPDSFKDSSTRLNNYVIDHKDFEITSKQQYLPAFKQMIALREQELKNQVANKHSILDFQVGDKHLVAVHQLSTTDENKRLGVIFEIIKDGEFYLSRTLEGYLWHDGATFKVEADADNGSDSRYDEERKKDPKFYDNQVPQVLANLRMLFEQIKGRDDLTIPTEPGFCISHGFIQGKTPMGKTMNVRYQHPKIKGLSLDFHLNEIHRDKSLLQEADWFLQNKNKENIHKGRRKINGLKVEKWLSKNFFVTSEGITFPLADLYVFKLSVNREAPSIHLPRLDIRMSYKLSEKGDFLPRDPELSEEELIAIWKKITSSLRLREGAIVD